jgi:flavin-dependent dehydrogenase
VDAITGEGIALGFEQALALAEAMQTGDLSEYQRAHNRIARRPRFMGDFMLTMDRWPAVRRRAMAAMAARPQLFEGLVAMHTGDLRPAAFAATCAALGWGMLADAAICTSAAWHIKLWARCLTRLTAASANRPR